jgi:hypothetical protein
VNVGGILLILSYKFFSRNKKVSAVKGKTTFGGQIFFLKKEEDCIEI